MKEYEKQFQIYPPFAKGGLIRGIFFRKGILVKEIFFGKWRFWGEASKK